MTCAEFKALANAYALGALDPDEQAAADAHLAEARIHQGCFDALADAETAASALVVALPQERPAEQVWDRIELQIGQDARREEVGVSRFRTYIGGLAVAAGVAAVALLFGRSVGQDAQRAADAPAIAQVEAKAKADLEKEQALTRTTQDQLGGQVDRCRKDLQTAQAQVEAQQKGMLLLSRPTTQLVAMAPSKGESSNGTVIFNRQTGQAVLVASALTAQAGHDYELWVIRGKEKLPAGLLKIDAKGPTLAVVDEKLLSGGVDVFAVTLEPAGGSTSPRGSLILAGAVKKG